jgi:hypothetical protein
MIPARLAFTALCAAAIAGTALPAEKGKSETERLKTRVAALEKQVAVLKAAVQARVSQEKRVRTMQRIEQLRDKLLAAGRKAGETAEFRELKALAGHEDPAVRGALAAALARLPGEVGSRMLTRMIADPDFESHQQRGS